MPGKVYGRKLNAVQNAACESLEGVSGLPPVGVDDLDAGHLTPGEFWRMNVVVIHDIYATVQNIHLPTD